MYDLDLLDSSSSSHSTVKLEQKQQDINILKSSEVINPQPTINDVQSPIIRNFNKEMKPPNLKKMKREVQDMMKLITEEPRNTKDIESERPKLDDCS